MSKEEVAIVDMIETIWKDYDQDLSGFLEFNEVESLFKQAMAELKANENFNKPKYE